MKWWSDYNESLVRRGEILILGFDIIDNWDKELEEMNRNKMGKRFGFPDSFILAIGYIHWLLISITLQTNGKYN